MLLNDCLSTAFHTKRAFFRGKIRRKTQRESSLCLGKYYFLSSTLLINGNKALAYFYPDAIFSGFISKTLFFGCFLHLFVEASALRFWETLLFHFHNRKKLLSPTTSTQNFVNNRSTSDSLSPRVFFRRPATDSRSNRHDSDLFLAIGKLSFTVAHFSLKIAAKL